MPEEDLLVGVVVAPSTAEEAAPTGLGVGPESLEGAARRGRYTLNSEGVPSQQLVT